MRFLASILLMILFVNAQAFTGNCADLCLHDKSSHNSHSQVNLQAVDHACCDTEEEQSHDCNPGHCMISMPADEILFLTAKPEIKKNPIGSDSIVEIDTLFRTATLSNKLLPLNYSDTHNLTLKVPLYIYHQKLLE